MLYRLRKSPLKLHAFFASGRQTRRLFAENATLVPGEPAELGMDLSGNFKTRDRNEGTYRRACHLLTHEVESEDTALVA